MEERIIRVDYQDEMKGSYIDYAMSVIVQRALPDIRDGLKPVHRRILYAMHDLDNMPDKPFKKSARIVGDVIGKYHPHGDSAVYETMVRMAQDFKMLLPIVEGHGNFGSIDGDSPAAMRYTEARLSKPALDLLGDLQYNVVDFQPNYDDTLKEPIVMPSRLPHLLINGVEGIAVGMTTNIHPHNPVETFTGIIETINNPAITVKKLMKYIKGPDFPTGGIIINKDELLSIYEKGEGTVRIRAKIKTENAGQGKTNIIITEIPYTFAGSKTKFINKFIDMAKERKLEELSDIRDESSKEGIRIVLEVKRGVDVDNLINKLYKKTPLEDQDKMNLLAIVNGRPEVLNLRQIIQHYIDFQKEITTKKYQFLLKRAEEREEILEGLVKATDVIDTIIEALRGSKELKMVRECLMEGKIEGITFKTKKAEKEAKKFNFTERQTTAILDMKLQRLIQLEINKLQQDLNDVTNSIETYKGILTEESKLLDVIKGYLMDMKKAYAQKRRTQIEQLDSVEYVEEVKEEELYILIDKYGYVKTTEVANMKRANEDTVNDFAFSFITQNTDKIGFFTNKGNFYQVKVADLPKGKVKDKGVPLENVSKMKKEEVILAGSIESILSAQLMFVTKQGTVKTVDGKEFESTRNSIVATKMDEEDEVVSIEFFTKPTEHVVLITKNGIALKFKAEGVPLQKKNSKGVKGLNVKENDEVRYVYVLDASETMNVEWKKQTVSLHELPLKPRGQAGKPIV